MDLKNASNVPYLMKAFRLTADDIGELYIENEDSKVLVEKFVELKKRKFLYSQPLFNLQL